MTSTTDSGPPDQILKSDRLGRVRVPIERREAIEAMEYPRIISCVSAHLAPAHLTLCPRSPSPPLLPSPSSPAPAAHPAAPSLADALSLRQSRERAGVLRIPELTGQAIDRMPMPAQTEVPIVLEFHARGRYFLGMRATVTSEGQITIPLRIREKLHLNAGDEIEFDEDAPLLTARRVVDRERWRKTVAKWREASVQSLQGHPWADSPTASIVDDLRGGPAESDPMPQG